MQPNLPMMGPVMWGPNVTCQILKWAMSLSISILKLSNDAYQIQQMSYVMSLGSLCHRLILRDFAMKNVRADSPKHGGPMSPVDFKKWQCHMSLSLIYAHVAYLCPCRMSNLRNDYVACRYLFLSRRMSLSLMTPDDFKKGPCRRVEFRGRGP